MKTEETTQHGGEAALVEQIASLQKQLDDCLDNEPKWIKHETFKSVIINTIAAQFMSVRKDLGMASQKDYKESPKGAWVAFRAMFFENGGEVCTHLFASQAFRGVMWTMNHFIDHSSYEVNGSSFEDCVNIANDILDNSTAEGWTLLLQGLSLIERSFSNDAEDFQWLRLLILNIHRCVKMWEEATEPSA
jgi:hypothetical protein